MSWLDRLAQTLGYIPRKAVQPQRPLPELLSAMAGGERFTIPEGWSVEQQSDLYKKLTWIQIGISHVAESAAGVKFSVRELQGEESEDVPNHPFELKLQRPNPLQSRFEFLLATFSYLRLTANAYWWLNTPDEHEPPIEIWVIPTHMITPLPDDKMFIKGYAYDSKIGPKIEIPPWAICHFKGFHPMNPFIGLSAIEAVNTVAVGDLAMQRWNTNYFGRENAKVPGALAYADPIPDPEWKLMKADLKEQWGGTHRSGPLMMRNVGKGGVEWLQMALSQKEMEFLESRRSTKEEMFGLFAPGLASVLDVNATEANALSGKATLMEYAVWPLLVSVGEKITNDLLPLYGENLVGAFDDPRVGNRVLDLQEHAAYERSHTIDEVRQRYYGDKPLGDERGQLLPAELARASAPAALGGQTSDGATEGNPAPTSPGKAMGDLIRWQRKCVNAIENDKAPSSVRFVSDEIDAYQYARIAAGLRKAKTIDDVRRVFDAELTPMAALGGRALEPRSEEMARLTATLADAIKAVRETT